MNIRRCNGVSLTFMVSSMNNTFRGYRVSHWIEDEMRYFKPPYGGKLMPSNIILINGNIRYEVPDSYMAPLEAYLEMVIEKTAGPVPARDEGPMDDCAQVPVQNESFAQMLANESLHMVMSLNDKLGPVLSQDDRTTPGGIEASPVVEALQAVHGHLQKLLVRVNL